MDLSKEEKKLYHKMGDNLGKIRGQFSQKQIAELINMKEGNYNTIEAGKGERHLKDIQIMKLAKYYNTSSDYLLGLIDDPSNNIEIQNTYKKYGLNESSLLTLNLLKDKGKDYGFSAEIDTINYLLEDIKINKENSIIALISEYLFTDSNFTINTTTNTHDIRKNIIVTGDFYLSSLLNVIQKRLIEARNNIKKEGEINEHKRKSKK